MATRLAEEIQAMGLPGEQASSDTKPAVNDLVIRGYLISVDEGSTVKRLLIGFGYGQTQMSVAVEGYQMTEQGLRKLGSGTLDSRGNKGPGAILPLTVLAATSGPIGLVVWSGFKGYDEFSGRAKVEGRMNMVIKEIATQIKPKFQEQEWIP